MLQQTNPQTKKIRQYDRNILPARASNLEHPKINPIALQTRLQKKKNKRKTQKKQKKQKTANDSTHKPTKNPNKE